ncbi:MAG: sugar ABC transporter permease [Oscillospiraceae bacterium]|nr:sugar ABC transporter permease [Oscillospiraceae bacterium]
MQEAARGSRPNTALKNHFVLRNKIWFFVLPSLVGTSVFFFIPAATMFIYAFSNARGEFVWFANFIDILTNSVFQLAASNSLLFMAVILPLNVVIPFLLASAMRNLRYKNAFAVAFMLPLIIPSGSVVFFWNSLFADNGAINSMLFQMGLDTVPWLMTDWAFWIVVLIFLFRNIGFNMVLFMAGLSLIPNDYYESVKLDGAGAFATFRNVTLVYIMPTAFLAFMMSIINSFRIFREIFLLFGPYPHHSVYMLQHFMNNQFLFANMQRLSVTAIALSVGVVILVVGVFTGQQKLSDTFS